MNPAKPSHAVLRSVYSCTCKHKVHSTTLTYLRYVYACWQGPDIQFNAASSRTRTKESLSRPSNRGTIEIYTYTVSPAHFSGLVWKWVISSLCWSCNRASPSEPYLSNPRHRLAPLHQQQQQHLSISASFPLPSPRFATVPEYVTLLSTLKSPYCLTHGLDSAPRQLPSPMPAHLHMPT